MNETRRNLVAVRLAGRRGAAFQLAKGHGDVGAVLVTDYLGVRYLCGFGDHGAVLLFNDKWAVVITSRMFKDRAPMECPGCEIVIVERGLDEQAPKVMAAKGIESVGVQEDCIGLGRFNRLAKVVPRKRMVLLPDVVMQARAVKADDEVAVIRKAIRIAEKAFVSLADEGAKYFIGRTEKQLAGELEYRMRQAGADGQAFPNGIIVGGGPNSAAAHHVPTDRKVKANEPVLFDWGALVAGYRSDITRVLHIGEKVSPRFASVYETVRQANAAAIKAIRAGVRAKDVDRAARELIAEAGYRDEFRHGLGHGIGMEVHESPRLNSTCEDKLKANMIVTVEPGVYFIDAFGIRIEDDIQVTADGAKRLTTLSRRLRDWVIV